MGKKETSYGPNIYPTTLRCAHAACKGAVVVAEMGPEPKAPRPEFNEHTRIGPSPRSYGQGLFYDEADLPPALHAHLPLDGVYCSRCRTLYRLGPEERAALEAVAKKLAVARRRDREVARQQLEFAACRRQGAQERERQLAVEAAALEKLQEMQKGASAKEDAPVTPAVPDVPSTKRAAPVADAVRRARRRGG